MTGNRILLPYSGVSVMLFHHTLGSPFVSWHHRLRKICISYTWEQEAQDIFFINLLPAWAYLSKILEYSWWVLASTERECNIKHFFPMNSYLVSWKKMSDVKAKYISLSLSCPFSALILCLSMTISHMLEKSGEVCL